MNRLQHILAQKPNNLLSVFYTAGYPHKEDTISIAQHLQDAGADFIEIGIPFSDPVADGPTIQESNKIALQNGMCVKLLLEQLRVLRKNVSIPVILMGYLNPVLQYGVEKFIKDAAEAGADGLILPDMPIDVYEDEYRNIFHQYGITHTFLISPTTSEKRIRQVDALSDSFIYAVSASSTTGAKKDFSPDQIGYFQRLQQLELKNPVLIGFGISNNHTFRTVSTYAAGAIVGSAFIQLLKNKNGASFKPAIEEFVRSLKGTV